VLSEIRDFKSASHRQHENATVSEIGGLQKPSSRNMWRKLEFPHNQRTSYNINNGTIRQCYIATILTATITNDLAAIAWNLA